MSTIKTKIHENFLTDITLRERLGLKPAKQESMAAFKTDLYQEIDTLQSQLDTAENHKSLMAAAIVCLLFACIAMAVIIYKTGLFTGSKKTMPRMGIHHPYDFPMPAPAGGEPMIKTPAVNPDRS
jgi:hypothetical protein